MSVSVSGYNLPTTPPNPNPQIRFEQVMVKQCVSKQNSLQLSPCAILCCLPLKYFSRIIVQNLCLRQALLAHSEPLIFTGASYVQRGHFQPTSFRTQQLRREPYSSFKYGSPKVDHRDKWYLNFRSFEEPVLSISQSSQSWRCWTGASGYGKIPLFPAMVTILHSKRTNNIQRTET